MGGSWSASATQQQLPAPQQDVHLVDACQATPMHNPCPVIAPHPCHPLSCSVYGLGIAAQHRAEGFRQYAPQAVPAILGMLQQPDARCVGAGWLAKPEVDLATGQWFKAMGRSGKRHPSLRTKSQRWQGVGVYPCECQEPVLCPSCCRSEDKEMAYENAVSALGKVLEFHPDCVEPAMGTAYVNALPIKADTGAGWVFGQVAVFVHVETWVQPGVWGEAGRAGALEHWS